MKSARLITILSFVVSTFLAYASWIGIILSFNDIARYTLFAFSLSSSVALAAVAGMLFLGALPSENDHFVINKESWYGRKFINSLSRFSSFASKPEYNFCEIFWYTNMLVVFDVVAAVVCSVSAFSFLVVLYLLIFETSFLEVLKIIGIAFGAILFIVGLVWALDRGNAVAKKKMPRLYNRIEDLGHATEDVGPLILIASFVALCFIAIVFAAVGVWKFRSVIIPIGMVLGSIAAFFAIFLIAKKLLKDTSLGNIFNNICPRVIIR